MLQIFETYIISIGRKLFSFVRVMMWSSIEMKSMFLQNIKTIFYRVIAKQR